MISYTDFIFIRMWTLGYIAMSLGGQNDNPNIQGVTAC